MFGNGQNSYNYSIINNIFFGTCILQNLMILLNIKVFNPLSFIMDENRSPTVHYYICLFTGDVRMFFGKFQIQSKEILGDGRVKIHNIKLDKRATAFVTNTSKPINDFCGISSRCFLIFLLTQSRITFLILPISCLAGFMILVGSLLWKSGLWSLSKT